MLYSVSYVISTVSVWQLLTIRVLHPSVNIANLQGCYSNKVKFLIMVSYTIFTAHVTYITLQIPLNIQDKVSNTTCLYLLEVGTGLCISFSSCSFAEEVT